MADPIDNQNDRNVGQQEQKMQQHQQNLRNERRRRMQKMQEIFLPGRLWEWRALTTTAAIQADARQPRPRSEGGG
jgi:hypothetical protein